MTVEPAPRQALADRINHALGHRLPERRVFIRSDTETRFIRLQPLTQLVGFAGAAVVIGWTIVASAVLMMESIGSGNLREQAQRDQKIYEARLNDISAERDARGAALEAAHDRYEFVLQQISEMQSSLLASEDRRKELETGIEVIQTTLRRTIEERDVARADLSDMRVTMAERLDAPNTPAGRQRDIAATLDMLADTLHATSAERDTMAETADRAMREADDIAHEKRLLEERNDRIFASLEEAVTVSMEPLDRMFRAAGLSTQQVLDQVRAGYSGTGGPLTPLSMSTRGEPPSREEARANGILSRLDRMNLYRIAAQKAPFARPTERNVRFTSGFGTRRDPKTGGRRMHNGLDFAGAHGSPIYATGDGVVVEAGWNSGYGRSVTIRHDFGLETLYAHMTRIHVSEGQRVSRGDRIGDMGSTGRSTGTHLHYEVHSGGKPVNPMTYIRAGQDVF